MSKPHKKKTAKSGSSSESDEPLGEVMAKHNAAFAVARPSASVVRPAASTAPVPRPARPAVPAANPTFERRNDHEALEKTKQVEPSREEAEDEHFRKLLGEYHTVADDKTARREYIASLSHQDRDFLRAEIGSASHGREKALAKLPKAVGKAEMGEKTATFMGEKAAFNRAQSRKSRVTRSQTLQRIKDPLAHVKSAERSNQPTPAQQDAIREIRHNRLFKKHDIKVPLEERFATHQKKWDALHRQVLADNFRNLRLDVHQNLKKVRKVEGQGSKVKFTFGSRVVGKGKNAYEPERETLVDDLIWPEQDVSFVGAKPDVYALKPKKKKVVIQLSDTE